MLSEPLRLRHHLCSYLQSPVERLLEHSLALLLAVLLPGLRSALRPGL